MSEHPSQLTLERLSVGELSPDVAASHQQHVAGCAECRASLEALEAARRRRLSRVPTAQFVAAVERRAGPAPRRFRPRWAVTVPLAVAAAAAVAFLVWTPPRDDTRFKGVGVSIERKRGDVVTRVGAGDGLRVGDALQVVVVLEQPSSVAVWFVDASGRVDALLDHTQSLPPGTHRLDGSAVVEAPCQDTWVLVGTGELASEATQHRLERLSAADRQAAQFPLPGLWGARLRCE